MSTAQYCEYGGNCRLFITGQCNKRHLKHDYEMALNNMDKNDPLCDIIRQKIEQHTVKLCPFGTNCNSLKCSSAICNFVHINEVSYSNKNVYSTKNNQEKDCSLTLFATLFGVDKETANKMIEQINNPFVSNF